MSARGRRRQIFPFTGVCQYTARSCAWPKIAWSPPPSPSGSVVCCAMTRHFPPFLQPPKRYGFLCHDCAATARQRQRGRGLVSALRRMHCLLRRKQVVPQQVSFHRRRWSLGASLKFAVAVLLCMCWAFGPRALGQRKLRRRQSRQRRLLWSQYCTARARGRTARSSSVASTEP